MKALKFIKILPVVVVLLTALHTLATETNSQPTMFRASIGTFRNYSYQVQLKEGVLLYSKNGRGEKTEIKITPTSDQWIEFRRELDRIKVWQWRGKYDEPLTIDGTGWSLLIGYSDTHIRTGGSNNYPDDKGKSSKCSTKSFEQYLAAVRKLIGDREFDK